MKSLYSNNLRAFALVATCIGMIACSPKSSNSPNLIQPATNDTVAATDITASGDAIRSMNVETNSAAAVESAASEDPMTLEEIFAAHPTLAEHSNFLASITSVVETASGNLDLYVGEKLVLVLSKADIEGGYLIKESTMDFTADSVTWMTVSEAQKVPMESLEFVLSHCIVKEEVPEQEQEQAQEEAKVEDPAQLKGTPEAAKEEPAKEEVQECAAVKITLNLKAIEQVQEQEQVKEEAVKEEVPVKEEQKQEADQEEGQTDDSAGQV